MNVYGDDKWFLFERIGLNRLYPYDRVAASGYHPNVQSAYHEIVSQTAVDDDADLLPDLVRRNLTPDRVENPVICDGFFVVFNSPVHLNFVSIPAARRPAIRPKPHIMRFIGRVFRRSGSLGGKRSPASVNVDVLLAALGVRVQPIRYGRSKRSKLPRCIMCLFLSVPPPTDQLLLIVLLFSNSFFFMFYPPPLPRRPSS